MKFKRPIKKEEIAVIQKIIDSESCMLKEDQYKHNTGLLTNGKGLSKDALLIKNILNDLIVGFGYFYNITEFGTIRGAYNYNYYNDNPPYYGLFYITPDQLIHMSKDNRLNYEL